MLIFSLKKTIQNEKNNLETKLLQKFCVIYITANFAKGYNSETGIVYELKTAYSSIYELSDTSEEYTYKLMDSFEDACRNKSSFGDFKLIKRNYQIFNTYKDASKFIEENTKIE